MSLAFCTDQPITTTAQDTFGFGTYAEALGRLALAGDSPITIGVFGPAGCGKTSLLNLITASLEEQAAAADRLVRIVWFNTERYAYLGSDMPRTLLVKALAALKPLDMTPEDAQQLIDWENCLSAANTSSCKLPDAFSTTFARWVHDYVVAREGRFVFFIDGLDACLPDHALDTLETARRFLSPPGSLCFLAADYDRLTASLNARYNTPVAEADAGSDDIHAPHLERLVQARFTLPPLSTAHIDALLARLASDLPVEARHVLTAGFPDNPRQLKRGLNALRLRQALTRPSADAPAPDAPAELSPTLLTKIIILQERYPELYAILVQHPHLLQELELRAQSAQAKSDSAAHPGTEALLPHIARYAADPYLARVLGDADNTAASFAHLAPHELRACLSLAVDANDPDRHVWHDLLSGNIARIRAAAAKVRQYQQGYSRALVRLMHRAYPAPIAQRLSAGLALGHLGDPRDFTETATIPAGEFPYGMEQRPCTLPAYRIGRYLITQAQYAEFLAAHPEVPVPYVDEDWARVYNWDPENRTYPAGRSNQPVVLITWDEAAAYCAWVGGRLPTQEEWERAARGDDGRSYPWGETFALVYANTRESGLGGPTPVGVFVEGASPDGVLDMAGNVWEWTASDYDANTKVLRGGAWNFPAESARVFAAERSRPHNRSHAIGFRVAFPVRQG